MLLGPASGLSRRQSAALGLALNPVAAVSFVLLLDLAQSLGHVPQALLTAGFASIAIGGLAGTLLARWALGRAGDITPGQDAQGDKA